MVLTLVKWHVQRFIFGWSKGAAVKLSDNFKSKIVFSSYKTQIINIPSNSDMFQKHREASALAAISRAIAEQQKQGLVGA